MASRPKMGYCTPTLPSGTAICPYGTVREFSAMKRLGDDHVDRVSAGALTSGLPGPPLPPGGRPNPAAGPRGSPAAPAARAAPSSPCRLTRYHRNARPARCSLSMCAACAVLRGQARRISVEIYQKRGVVLAGYHGPGADMTEEPNRTRGIQAEMLVGVSAVVIGVCALGVSLYETSLMREQQRAAVCPFSNSAAPFI